MSNTSTVGHDHWRVHYYEWEVHDVYSFRTEKVAREMAQELMLSNGYGGQWTPVGENKWTLKERKTVEVIPYSFEEDLQELKARKESCSRRR